MKLVNKFEEGLRKIARNVIEEPEGMESRRIYEPRRKRAGSLKYYIDGECPACRQKMPDIEGIVMDSETRLITAKGRTMYLPQNQFEIFFKLFTSSPRAVTKNALYDHLYQLKPEADWPDDQIIDVYICKLKKNIRAVELDNTLEINNIHGSGYKLTWNEEEKVHKYI